MRRPGYVSIHELSQAGRWPSRPVLYKLIAVYGIKRYKFPADRRTYIRRADLRRVMRRPEERA